jgi:hypothetical protein
MILHFPWLVIGNTCTLLSPNNNITPLYQFSGVVVAVIVWLLDLQLLMQSVPITTAVVSSNLDQGEVYNIMW